MFDYTDSRIQGFQNSQNLINSKYDLKVRNYYYDDESDTFNLPTKRTPSAYEASSIEEDFRDGFVSNLYSQGSIIKQKNREEFKAYVVTEFLQNEKTIIRCQRSDKSRIEWACYFSRTRQFNKFPSITPETPCRFFMKWFLNNSNPDSVEYHCGEIYPYHNHKKISNDQIDIMPQCSYLPKPLKDDAVQLFSTGITLKQVHSMLSQKYPYIIINESKLRYFLQSKYQGHSQHASSDIEDILHYNLKEDDIMPVKDSGGNKLFVTTARKVEIWNRLKDVILIESAFQIHPHYSCCMTFFTVDTNGIDNLIAMAMIKVEAKENYAWAFNCFKEQGLCDPKNILVDSNPIKYEALIEVFPESNILFSYHHIEKRLKSILVREWIFINDQFLSIYESENHNEMLQKYSSLLHDYPELEKNNEISNLMIELDSWAKFSIKNHFTAGLDSKKRLKEIEKLLRKLTKLIKRNKNFQIFSYLEAVFESSKENLCVKNLSMKSATNIVNNLLKNINGIQYIYTPYCVLHILSSIRDSEFCSIDNDSDKEILVIVDNSKSARNARNYQVDWENNYCTCEKIMRYGIACSHLIYICKLARADLIRFIVKTTSRRWLLQEMKNKCNDEILRDVKYSYVMGNLKVDELSLR